MIHGCDHVGITVTNLERSIQFYEDLGFETVGRWSRSEPYVQRVVGYFPDVVLEIAEMTIPGSPVRLEILEYRGVAGTQVDTASANPGTGHVCLLVEDLDELHARMTDRGAAFVSAVETSTAGPIKGGKVVYMIDPDGIRVELVELPKGGGDGSGA